MIIWLASYPKSGNTWVRSILAALLYSSDGAFNFDLIKKIPQFPKKEVFKDLVKDFSNFNEIKKNWITVQEKINSEKEIKLLKTHNGKYTVEKDNFTDDQNSLAVIYIVRDPRTLVKSISNHFTKSHYDASKFLIAPSLIGNGKSFEERKDGILTLLGKWNDHYRSWTKNKNNLLLIKYEDLVNNPETELTKLIKFLEKYINFKTSEKKNKTILETTSFSNLKNMEEQGLFKEGVLNKKTNNKANFFHLGPKNKWQENLDKKIINEIEKNFYNEMKELGYLK